MKKVLVIGNGKCEKKLGLLIDNSKHFHKVIRVGKYKTLGNEEYVGTRTDISFILNHSYNAKYHKEDIVMVYTPNMARDEKIEDIRSFDINGNLVRPNVIHVYNKKDNEYVHECFNSCLGKKIYDYHKINFSLGFRALILTKRDYPDCEIYTCGFNFFTKSGWHWNNKHNRNMSNRHPYLLEKLCYDKMLKRKELFKL